MKLDNGTGIKNTGSYQATSLSVFPDPNKGSFTVNISAALNEEAHIIITDVAGRKVKDMVTTTNTNTAILLDAAPGLYFINAITGQGEQCTEVVVQ